MFENISVEVQIAIKQSVPGSFDQQTLAAATLKTAGTMTPGDIRQQLDEFLSAAQTEALCRLCDWEGRLKVQAATERKSAVVRPAVAEGVAVVTSGTLRKALGVD